MAECRANVFYTFCILFLALPIFVGNSAASRWHLPETMNPRIEDVEHPAIGRFYEVPCVEWRRVATYPDGGEIQFRPTRPIWCEDIMPVLGPLHDDKEIIGFPEDHWHVDWRFVSQRVFKIASYGREDGDASRSARVISLKNSTGSVIRKWLKMKRIHVLFPGFTEHFKNPWLRKLEAKYAGRSLKCGVCPHRGISLANAPLEAGLLVCPGHGLAFHPATGLLTPRTE